MPARKRRDDLMVATAADVRAQAQIAGLHEAAARALRLHDWQAATRHGGRPLAPETLAEHLAEPAAAPAAPRKGLRWPFGRKPDLKAERRAAILSELEAAVAGRPRAGDAARAQEAEAKPAAAPLRAAG